MGCKSNKDCCCRTRPPLDSKKKKIFVLFPPRQKPSSEVMLFVSDLYTDTFDCFKSHTHVCMTKPHSSNVQKNISNKIHCTSASVLHIVLRVHYLVPVQQPCMVDQSVIVILYCRWETKRMACWYNSGCMERGVDREEGKKKNKKDIPPPLAPLPRSSTSGHNNGSK